MNDGSHIVPPQYLEAGEEDARYDCKFCPLGAAVVQMIVQLTYSFAIQLECVLVRGIVD
jgi:hypothetical protein